MATPRLRVITGRAGGRRLVAPPHVRPTTERVREAVFSALGDHVVDAAVLDLYAGSGALAVEALSRGAAVAVLVDADRAATAACQANLDTTGLAALARVRTAPVARFLAGAPPGEAPFDLVLVDAPYAAAPTEVTPVLEALTQPGWLTSEARVVLETAATSPPPEPAGTMPLEVRSRRKYGDTLVTTLGTVPRA
jgi:16S rRNA (guanine966-N2)-methyltransferase